MLYRRRRASKPLSHSAIPRSGQRRTFVYTEYCRSFYSPFFQRSQAAFSLPKRGLQPVADSKAPSVSRPLISDDDAACPLSFMTFLSALFPLLPSVLLEFLSPFASWEAGVFDPPGFASVLRHSGSRQLSPLDVL